MIDTPDFQRGACVGLDDEAVTFFPARGEPAAPAKQVCALCDIRGECREYAIHHEKYGIWGGLGAGERKRIRSMRGIELVTPGDATDIDAENMERNVIPTPQRHLELVR